MGRSGAASAGRIRRRSEARKLDDAVGFRDASDNIDDSNVVENQQRKGEHAFRVMEIV